MDISSRRRSERSRPFWARESAALRSKASDHHGNLDQTLGRAVDTDKGNRPTAIRLEEPEYRTRAWRSSDAICIGNNNAAIVIRLPRVLELTGRLRSTVWRLERAGLFPHRRRVSANVVAWLESDVTACTASSHSSRTSGFRSPSTLITPRFPCASIIATTWAPHRIRLMHAVLAMAQTESDSQGMP